MFNTPILFLIFNRIELTKITFDRIRSIKPKYLYIAADGPRLENKNDELNCSLCREYVLSNIDWNCKIRMLFQKNNLGCGLAVSSAISWFFSFVEEGIILEDDCLADISFFKYCQNMLERYRYDTQIFHINGSNHQYGIWRGNSDYYFSIYPHVWGWATWRRAWLYYDYEMTKLDEYSNSPFFKKFAQLDLMNNVKGRIVDTWDVQWVYSLFVNNGWAITPNLNLISNLGFDNFATHTKYKIPAFVRYSNNGSFHESIIHPSKKRLNKSADNFTTKFVHKINVITCFDILKLKTMRVFYNYKSSYFLLFF